MSAAPSSKHVLVALAIATGAGVFALFAAFEQPGVGIGHGFYLAVGLAAIALGVLGGAVAGLIATALFMLGGALNEHLATYEILSVPTLIRCVMFVSAGALLGWYGSRNRQLQLELTDAVRRLRVLAARDALTGLGNTRAFEDAVTRRLAGDRPFALLLASFSEANAAEIVRDVALRLTEQLPPSAEVTRVSSDTFAVLVECSEGEVGLFAATIQRALDRQEAQVTLGWATTPTDGDTPLSLYRAAEERLYVRRMVLRGQSEQRRLTAV